MGRSAFGDGGLAIRASSQNSGRDQHLERLPAERMDAMLSAVVSVVLQGECKALCCCAFK